MEKKSADYNRTKIEDRAIRDEYCYEGFHIDLTRNPQPAVADTTTNLSLNNVGAGDISSRTKTVNILYIYVKFQYDYNTQYISAIREI